MARHSSSNKIMHTMAVQRPFTRSHCARPSGKSPRVSKASIPARRTLLARAAATTAQTLNTELGLLSTYSVVVPDGVASEPSTVKANAAAVSFGLLRSIVTSEALGMKPLENAIAAARTYHPNLDLQVEKAMANVGAILAEQVSGKVSTEIDPRLAHDKAAMVRKAKSLACLYAELDVPASRLLFRMPATWEGIAAAKELESQGLPTHLYLVFSLVQGVAAAQAGASLVNPNVGRTREWFNKHPGVIRDPKGPRQDAGLTGGVDPGVRLVTDLYNCIKVHHPNTRIMASGLRTRTDALALAGCDFLLLPRKVISELQSMPTMAGYNDGLHAAAGGDESQGFRPQLTVDAAKEAAPNKLGTITEADFNEGLGIAGKELLSFGIADALKDVEALASLTKATTGRSST